jgi:hypothetical protein
MTGTAKNIGAREEATVKALYEDFKVAESYIAERFSHSWGRLLHCKQVAEVNRIVEETKPADVLEIAPAGSGGN